MGKYPLRFFLSSFIPFYAFGEINEIDVIHTVENIIYFLKSIVIEKTEKNK